MLETYHVEIIRKRRAARIFWLIVFVCSWFLYFFFQGYYPDVRVWLRHIFSESGSESYTGSSDLIRSFGIINVRTTQPDTTILLGSNIYNNNEKRMSDYGDYSMAIDKPGYIKNILKFRIDREKPFFIEKISLLPLPTYKKLDGVLAIYPIENGESLARTASGIISSGSQVNEIRGYTGSFVHIGGKYFRTNSGILSWEWTQFKKVNPDIKNYVETCSDLYWNSDIFYCPKSQSLLTQSGRYMTGILNIQNNLIAQSGGIIELKNWILGKSWTQSGEINLENIVIINDIFYVKKSGDLISKNNIENITTLLSNIDYASLLGEDTILVWKKEWKTHLIVRHPGDPIDRERDIILPENLSYKDIEFHSLDGNIMIVTPNGILFIYRSANDIHWIVEWEILLYKNTGAIYRKNGEIWETNWSDKR